MDMLPTDFNLCSNGVWRRWTRRHVAAWRFLSSRRTTRFFLAVCGARRCDSYVTAGASRRRPANSFDEPFCVSIDVDHRHRAAKLKLGDQLEQECGRGLSLNDHLMRVASRIKK